LVGSMCFRNVSIQSLFSSLLGHIFEVMCHNPLICSPICCDIFLFIFNFISLGFLSFWVSLAQGLSILLIFSRSIVLFFGVYIINFSYSPLSFLFTGLEFGLFLFF
jgi:hypothetical protein